MLALPARDGLFDDGAPDEGVVQHVREAAEDGALVEGMVLAPVQLALRDVLLRGHAGDAAVLAGEVGGVERGDGDLPVEVALGVVGVEELAGAGEGVAGEQHAGGVEALERLHLVLWHGVRLRDDDQQFRRVEALQVVRLVGGEADGEPIVVDDPVRAGDAPAEGDQGALVRSAQLPPDDLLHLPLRGAGDDDLGKRAGGEPPEDDARGNPVLARAVCPDDADAPMLRDLLQHLPLLRVGLVAQHFFHEADGIVPVCVEHYRHLRPPPTG